VTGRTTEVGVDGLDGSVLADRVLADGALAEGEVEEEREPTEAELVAALLPGVGFDAHEVLSHIDELSAQRPVAAQIVALTHAEDAGAREVARLLAADAALTGRVLKLANSAFYGLRGRVSSLQFAVTVVGFSTVRSMASVALTSDQDGALPPDHWTTTTHLALACEALAPRVGHRPQDAMCTGLLALLGTALLTHHDPAGYAEVAVHRGSAARRAAELERFGVHSVELTGAAMRHWGFPDGMVRPVLGLDDPESVDGALLRTAFEVTDRLTVPGHVPGYVEELSCGRVREADLRPVLARVATEAADLGRALVT